MMDFRTSTGTRSDSTPIVTALALVVLLTGITILVGGWATGISLLHTPVTGTASVKANTALSLATIALGLLALSYRRLPWVAAVAVVPAFAVGIVTAVEYLLSLSTTSFDQLLATDETAAASEAAGRPSFTAAVAITALALGMWFFASGNHDFLGQLLFGLAGIIGYVACLGFIMHSEVLLALSPLWTQISPVTAVSLIMLAIAGTLLRPNRGYVQVINARTSGGRQARLLIPLALFIGFLLAVSVRLMTLARLPHPIPEQVVVGVFISLMLIAVVAVTFQTNTLEFESHRRSAIAAAFDSATDGVLVVRRDGTIEMANDSAANLTGYSTNRLIGSPVAMLIPPAEQHRFATAHAEFWKAEPHGQARTRIQPKMIDAAGKVRTVDVGLGVIGTEPSRQAIIATIRDNTELIRANEELEQFAYVASHDLRAPLRAVLGFADLLDQSLRDSDLSDEQRDFLAEILAGAHRMDGLIQALLEYSRIGRDSATQSVAVHEQVEEVLKTVAMELTAAGASIENTVPTGLRWDVVPPLMDSAITNIITNAVNYRSPERALLVTISAQQDNTGTTLTIKDNGQGIAPAQISRATLIFQRLSQDGTGLGIGLASVRRIVDAHKGTLDIRSDGGTFTEVSITVPRARKS